MADLDRIDPKYHRTQHSETASVSVIEVPYGDIAIGNGRIVFGESCLRLHDLITVREHHINGKTDYVLTFLHGNYGSIGNLNSFPETLSVLDLVVTGDNAGIKKNEILNNWLNNHKQF